MLVETVTLDFGEDDCVLFHENPGKHIYQMFTQRDEGQVEVYFVSNATLYRCFLGVGSNLIILSSDKLHQGKKNVNVVPSTEMQHVSPGMYSRIRVIKSNLDSRECTKFDGSVGSFTMYIPEASVVCENVLAVSLLNSKLENIVQVRVDIAKQETEEQLLELRKTSDNEDLLFLCNLYEHETKFVDVNSSNVKLFGRWLTKPELRLAAKQSDIKLTLLAKN